MRTVALLAALLLLVLQALAEPVPEKAEEAPEEQQAEEEDQDVAISFAGARRSGLQDAGRAVLKVCRCTRGNCRSPEVRSGSCYRNGKISKFCCR